MAKDSSFDVVSEVDMQEVDNAFQQATKEISQRYDLKNANATLEFSKPDKTITIVAPADFVITQVRDVLNTKLIRRGVDIKALKWSEPKPSSGANLTSTAQIMTGLSSEDAKQISKDIKAMGLKVKPTIEDAKVRVASPSKDALQTVIQNLRGADYDFALQFVNYR